MAATFIRLLAVALALALTWAIWTFLPPLMESGVIADFALILTIGAIVLALSALQFAYEKLRPGSS